MSKEFIHELFVLFNVLTSQCGVATMSSNFKGFKSKIFTSTSMDSISMDSTSMDATSMDSTSMDATLMDATSMDSTSMDSTSIASSSLNSIPVGSPSMPSISNEFTSSHPNDPEKESRSRISAIVEVYDAVIQANNILDKKYKDQEDILIKKQAEIRAELNCYHKQKPEKRPKQEFFRYCTVGRPYFKDKDFEYPSDNEDTEIMKMWNMYDFSNVMTVSGWTVGDKARLLAIILDLSKDLVKKDIYEKISQLQLMKEKDDACKAKIEDLKRELFELKDKELDDLNLPEHLDLDWQEISAKLNKRHSAGEYKAIWDLFFHPRVNKKSWTQYEHLKLQRIVSERGKQNWEAIAKAMGTNRTGYQCFVYYCTNVSHAASGRKWTHSEVSYLEKLVSVYKEQNYIPWGRVAAFMPNRTKIQCYNKYLRVIEKRKGRFLPEEDAVILNFVKKYGPDFRRMSQFLSGRSAVQLRVRYNLLRKLRVSATWTIEDDRKLLQIMAYQDSNSNFSDATPHFPGKDRQHIRSRYNTLMRWMKCHPHSDVSAAPRRAARRLPYGAASSSLLEALGALRERMDDELHNPKGHKVKHKLTRSSSESAIHSAIMSTIANLETSLVVTKRTLTAKVQDWFEIMEVKNISSTPEEQLNLFNTQYFLFTLNTKIADKAKFINSVIGHKFKDLEDKKPPEMGKFRSYSKVEKTAAVIETDFKPDLFGKVAGRRFLIPPNFASLTGSRMILNYQGYFKERAILKLKALARRDDNFKRALNSLRERFVDIFTWPYVLSNLSPEFFKVTLGESTYRRAKETRPGYITLPDVPAVTIPSLPKRLQLKKNTKGIDDDHQSNKDDINISLNLPEINLDDLNSSIIDSPISSDVE